MAQYSVTRDKSLDVQPNGVGQKCQSREHELAISAEDLRRRFDDAYDRAEMLSRLIEERQADGVDCAMMLGRLREAEAEKRAAFVELRKARWMKAPGAP